MNKNLKIKAIIKTNEFNAINFRGKKNRSCNSGK